MKTYLKIIMVSVLVILCLILTWYFHFIVKTQILFTHLFYIPIVIASIYWKRAGIGIAIFLGVYLPVSQYISTLALTPPDFIRSVMFVTIALVVTILMNRNKEINIRLKHSEEYISLNKELTETNKQLQSAKKEVEERESQLKDLNNTKDKLFSIIAHDLKSPFNSILGFSDLLISNYRDYDHEKTENFLFHINSTSRQTLALLDNLLDWASLQSGQIIIKKEKLALQPIISDIIRLLDSPSKMKNISLHISQPDNVVVFADKNMLQTILRNLVCNAIKFTHPGGKVDVTVVSGNKQVEVSVMDNGIGMSNEVINKLFNIDTNFTTPGTAKEKGSGLGLLLCKEFVEKSGGELRIESESGKGSKFTFTLPMG